MASGRNAVINPQFCVPYPIDLAFTTKPPGGDKSGHLAAVDAAGNTLFRAKNQIGLIQLQDAAGHTIFSIKPKIPSFKNWWKVFAGDSTEKKDLAFLVRRTTSFFHSNEEWLVYLAANTQKEKCDFKIIGSYSNMNYTFYSTDSSFTVAQLTKEHKLSFPLEKDAFGAAISPNCDSSFLAALIAIFHFLHGVDKAAMGIIFATVASTAIINS